MLTHSRIKQFLLIGQSFIYLIAFASLYWQIPGLYGERGLLPIATRLKCGSGTPWYQCTLPLLQFGHIHLSLSPSVAYQLLSLCGIALSIVTILLPKSRNILLYLGLYYLYLTAFEAGSTFLWFQWDTLLLESGFLMATLAGFTNSPADSISIFLVNWLVVRLMFASGVVKLQSNCPTWWGLTALDYHYESQCIPSTPAWHFHHMPEWFRKFSVAMTFYIEIYLPPLFLLPLRPLKYFAFANQFTGNYNFFNMHYALLCVAMLEDLFLCRNKWFSRLEWILSILVLGAVTYLFVLHFGIQLDLAKMQINSKIMFDRALFEKGIKIAMTIIIHVALLMFTITALIAAYRIYRHQSPGIRKYLTLVFTGTAATALFFTSFVSFTVLDRNSASRVPEQIKKLHEATREWQLFHSYGLFRQMTGVEGRPEIIVEGSHEPNGPWTPFEFYSKPGDVNQRPIFVAPHQPRLDWQMWFAALGSYHHNPFFLSLVHHLLRNSSDVVRLMKNYPFNDKEKPLKFVKAQLYHYRFSPPTEKKAWWTRAAQEEYLAPLSKDAPALVDYLKQNRLFVEKPNEYKNGEFGKVLRKLHRYVYSIDQTQFVWAEMAQSKEKRVGRWYFGGLASAGAACCTHPLDLLKVHLQTQQQGKMTITQMCSKIFKSDGFMGFYNGLSASLLRQLTYSTTRFGIYETVKAQIGSDANLPFYQKALLAGFSGACGGLVGTPGDLINVRMQNDMKVPLAERRNYKHALDGLVRISREEGMSKLFNGATMATSRAILMTIGQLSFYDQIKQMLIQSGYAKDNLATHFFSSFCAATIATAITQPLDVMKTRMMNASPGQFSGIMGCFVYTAKLGPMGFFKGFIPAWVRLAPHTVLMFIFFEQLRMNFGYFKESKKE
ncbi:hypothetical protein WR25_03198 [Diploscapter pachys]|uniref:Lipase maturation factor n=1 Tax=Diploscapter pachys TaxID=2018661 RepID=A0A2A2KYN1_9BILA|nr:hypothetical protein WR25_03198 [Diploscapter pachys]